MPRAIAFRPFLSVSPFFPFPRSACLLSFLCTIAEQPRAILNRNTLTDSINSRCSLIARELSCFVDRKSALSYKVLYLTRFLTPHFFQFFSFESRKNICMNVFSFFLSPSSYITSNENSLIYLSLNNFVHYSARLMGTHLVSRANPFRENFIQHS